ncbi:PH domain-containing protein [Synoicihabitans lomoniglobus]|uniref:PH domain-containing protein n=1 Tax=Synoicihabitans lomoniglobus TaxID=2909285 RepID=A0AAE9ZTI3_9BACT|nr:PH domain-containing protein [Opitutaceae bacterium LMO-M01]WED64890.1 PH domain-containing protein [Opitutaceae bacterium LMO-M01]
MHPAPDDEAILAIERPHRDLLKYYMVSSFVLGPFFPVLMIYGAIRFKTMRYKFTDEGISMSWGILFRREIILQYSRIQDIHLRSNVIERWLGLAKVLVQTASGSSGAEMTLEGLKEFEPVRDYLYSRMRGVKDDVKPPPVPGTGAVVPAGEGTVDAAALTAVLTEVAAELRGLREDLAAREDVRRD